MSEESKPPCDVVAVPAWVVEIEEKMEGPLSSFGVSRAQIERLCREVRELLAITADLKESKGEMYAAVRSYDYEGDTIMGVFHTRIEAQRCLDDAGETSADLRIDVW